MTSRAVGDFPLDGKIAVVTGGGSGINLAFACLAHSKGARVIIADLRLTKASEAFLTTSPENAIFQLCDVTKRSDLEKLIGVSQKQFGDIPDVYVAGAGVFEPAWSNFWDDTEDDGYASLAVNAMHPMKLTRIAIRALAGRDKPGVVLIVASVLGLVPVYAEPLYSAAKHAVVGFTRGMHHADRLEGVRVVTICPGLVKSPLWTSRPELVAGYGITDDLCQMPDEVAVEMAALVEEGAKYPGGSVLKTTKWGTTVVPWPEGSEELDKTLNKSNDLPGERTKKERGTLVQQNPDLRGVSQ